MKQIDLLSISDLDLPTVEQLAVRAIELSEHWDNRTMPQTLTGTRIGLIAELPGWRNPTALALGVATMGGTCVTVTAKLQGAESVEDLAGYMDNWFDLLAVRTPQLSQLREFSGSLVAPVMNLRTHDNHPCEVLGDLGYVLSVRGSWDELKVAMVGPAGNIARSWVEAAAVLPIEVVQVAPPHLALSKDEFGSRSSTTNDLRVIEEADIVVTDCWPNNASNEEKEILGSLRIDSITLDRCRADVMFIPCPPVTRGEEVSIGAMKHEKCLATPAKAFLMHTQNAFVEKATRRTQQLGSGRDKDSS
ncbi:ornithine carbamoyltransferase [Granulosicoccus antarcticus]|uniref:Ornithine carbamoyltransferase 1, phaseolotoxin-sensitive n=1 Tax=Granulosicoccus antarcticus IMCC3135 TaxID=1192854 RepID=A0A2Z2NWI3_9GAMM|nr:ornithine carbamoyltransferase [Granulosicoccus antarcticus]ASJ73180.1 Ornithine carbamoyltransferase 1, phaseolotoxin-sensitive [Granulosicoccus antarcticus IMCC3135]